MCIFDCLLASRELKQMRPIKKNEEKRGEDQITERLINIETMQKKQKHKIAREGELIASEMRNLSERKQEMLQLEELQKLLESQVTLETGGNLIKQN